MKRIATAVAITAWLVIASAVHAADPVPCEYFAADGSQPIPEGYAFVNGDPDAWVGPSGCAPYVEVQAPSPTFAMPDTAMPTE